MIQAFSTHPTIATRYEELIGQAILSYEGGRKTPPSLHRPHGNSKNMGTTKKKHTWLQGEWRRRATLVRAYLKKHPGARTTDIAEGVGVEMRAMAAWCDKFRNSDEDYGIRHVKSMETKKYNYWRSEDTPKAGNAK